VYENEPQVNAGLLKNAHVILLPHIGTATYETQKEMELLVLENLRKALLEGKLITPIPEQSPPLPEREKVSDKLAWLRYTVGFL
jgi:glyoxylate reductase